jgi:hypothetical protein
MRCDGLTGGTLRYDAIAHISLAHTLCLYRIQHKHAWLPRTLLARGATLATQERLLTNDALILSVSAGGATRSCAGTGSWPMPRAVPMCDTAAGL